LTLIIILAICIMTTAHLFLYH